MAESVDELEFVAWMVRLGKENRDLYRKLRSEAWELVQENHAAKSDVQRELWLRSSS